MELLNISKCYIYKLYILYNLLKNVSLKLYYVSFSNRFEWNNTHIVQGLYVVVNIMKAVKFLPNTKVVTVIFTFTKF